MKEVRELPGYVTREEIAERLPLIFPDGTPNRNYCIRELAASTIFTMLYIGAVEGSGRFLAPKHVYRMTDEQAKKGDPGSRLAYAKEALKPGFHTPGHRWYADNTREPIRDETLREGLVATGAVHLRTDLPTTSSKPRYALTPSFAALFEPGLKSDEIELAIETWRTANLSRGALARIAIQQSGAAASKDGVVVTFPNG